MQQTNLKQLCSIVEKIFNVLFLWQICVQKNEIWYPRFQNLSKFIGTHSIEVGDLTQEFTFLADLSLPKSGEFESILIWNKRCAKVFKKKKNANDIYRNALIIMAYYGNGFCKYS